MSEVSRDPEEKIYHMRIDELIEDAEIEAEIEAEKKVRSKNARLLSISLVGVALIAFIFFQVKTGSQAISSKDAETGPLPELAQAPAVIEPAPASEAPGPEPVSVPEPIDAPQASPPVVEKQEMDAPVAEAETPATAAPVEKAPDPVVAQITPKQPPAPPVEKVKAPQAVKPSAPAPTRKEISTHKYHVQLGVFSMEDNAKRFAKNIQAKNFPAAIQTKPIEATRYVVFVGGFSNEEGGNQAITELKNKGFHPVMENFENNSHTLVLGKFKTSSEAEALRDRLSVNGFLSSAKKSQVKTNIHIVQVGPFASLPQAKNSQKNIERAGFSNSFIRQ